MEETVRKLLSELGPAAEVLRTMDGNESAVAVRSDYSVEDLEQFMDRPTRVRSRINAEDLGSFIGYLNSQKERSTTVYVSEDREQAVGVIDHHHEPVEVDEGRDFTLPEWGHHKTVFGFPKTPEWAAWTGSNRTGMSQPAFAAFIEDNLPDIIDPSQAEMMTVAREIQASKNGNFEQVYNETSGSVTFHYSEEVKGRTKTADMEVPETFAIRLEPFRGAGMYVLTARLRYRIDDGVLRLWYDLLRPHKVWEEAVANVKERIERETNLPVYKGTIC